MQKISKCLQYLKLVLIADIVGHTDKSQTVCEIGNFGSLIFLSHTFLKLKILDITVFQVKFSNCLQFSNCQKNNNTASHSAEQNN